MGGGTSGGGSIEFLILVNGKIQFNENHQLLNIKAHCQHKVNAFLDKSRKF